MNTTIWDMPCEDYEQKNSKLKIGITRILGFFETIKISHDDYQMSKGLKMEHEYRVLLDEEGYETDFEIAWEEDNFYIRWIGGTDIILNGRYYNNHMTPYYCSNDGVMYDDLAYMAYKLTTF